ncbi:MAG: hypothetical protein LBJ12_07995 [Oscillospiraceae bacterium]|jgi:hypothetical protein|nr:hypothetical protein [Oscillospiraceae bacterium]
MIEPTQLQSLFLTRETSLCYFLTEAPQGTNLGWAGGNAPAYFDDKANLVHDAEYQYSFYMAFVNPVNERMLSVFIPDFSVYNQYSIYPDCAIKVIEHAVSAESALALYMLRGPEPTLRKSYLSLGTNEPAFLHIGGEPNLIQNNEDYEVALLKDGYQFFGMANEEYYTTDLVRGNYPFCYGAVYFYAKINQDSITDIRAGFWQNS